MPGSPPSVTAFDFGTAGQLAEKNKNRLIIEAQENLGAFTADSLRLKQILLNLAEQCLQVTGCTSAGKLEMTPSISAVVRCCSSASASFFFRSALAARTQST